jgi:hypothetical protein
MADTTARPPSGALTDLPDDVREIIAPHVTENQTTLAAIGVAIAAKREEAKARRTASGIETTWHACEEAYIGIDDANRHEYTDGRWSKPMSVDGPVTTGRAPDNKQRRSTVFVRLTARYVDAGAAKLSEILLPPDDKAFSFSEMPVPELIRAKEDLSQVYHEGIGAALTRPANPGEIPPPGPATAPGAPGASVPLTGGLVNAPGAPPQPAAAQAAAPLPSGAARPGGAAQPAGPGAAPGAPPQVPLTVRDLALENIEIARKMAKAAETRIFDWMVACQWPAQMRKVIFDSAKMGVGVLKAPYPKASRQIAVTKTGAGIEITIREDVSPAAAWVDPWNIFPDPACGENIHDGDFIFERDYLTARQVRDLKKLDGYIAAQIDMAMEEGPQKANLDSDSGPGGAPTDGKVKGRYQVWYFYGMLTREEIAALDAAAGKPPSNVENKEQIYAIVTLINDRAVRATINPLESGAFPYHSVPWQRRAGHWAGLGVAEQLKAPQRITNASLRAILNNAGKSAGSQFVIDRSGIYPMDGDWTATPDKFWGTTADGAGRDVHTMFAVIDIPNVTQQLMLVLNYGMQLAEESTSIPLVTQGQSGETSPETFGATQLQDTNANQLLRSIGYAFDDFITEPVVRQFYEWLLLDPGVPDSEKGDFKVNAHGSAALVERAIQDQTIGQLGQAVANPAYGGDPKKWFKQMLRSKRLDPVDFTYTEEEQARLDAQPPPEPPAVTVAKIGADTAMKQIAAKQTTEQQGAASEERIAQAANVLEGGHVQNEAARIQAEQHRTLTEQTVKLHEIQARRELAELEYANRYHISLDQVKATLAKTAMTLQTQRALNAEDNAADARRNRPERPERGAKPPAQTPGRAGNGRAFEQGAPPA